jgi:DNA (cytosine-5)-methyltransferase 1
MSPGGQRTLIEKDGVSRELARSSGAPALRGAVTGRPRLLDLFCCAGGAAMGYHRAGFDVVGVDIKPQPRYPFPQIVRDVMRLSPAFIAGFDAIHASPPCQCYTELRHSKGTRGAPKLIGAVRCLLEDSGKPWIIENVEAAAGEMHEPIMLCGSMFGLGAQGHQLQRHRLFEASVRLSAPACEHDARPVVGIYGGHARCRSAKHGGRKTADAWIGGHRAAASDALGIDWMTLGEMSEAIPPAYTEFLGHQLMRHLQLQVAA